MTIMTKNNNIFRYVAGACFAAYGLEYLRSIRAGFYGWDLICFVGVALVSISMFVSLPILTSVGAGMNSISDLYYFFSSIEYVLSISGYPKYFAFNSFLSLAFWLILVVIGINKKGTKQLGFIAGGLASLRFASRIIRDIMHHFTPSLNPYVFFALLIVGAFMIGMAADCATAKAPTSSNVTTGKVTSSASSDSHIERIIKLKELLDSGVITQDEFEAKKKQVLGQ